MALRWFDSLGDHCGATDFSVGLYESVGGLSLAAGRFGGNAAVLSGTGGALQKNLDNQATWIVGFAYRPDGQAGALYAFNDSGAIQCYVQINASKHLQFVQGGSGTVLATGTATLNTAVWYYIEIQVTIHNTAGAFEVRVGGTQDMVASGQNTRGGSSNNFANQVALRSNINSNTSRFDDYYVCDSTGADTFRGECRVETVFPNGAGSSTQWTPLSGANWQNVSETSPDGDTSYNSDSTATDIDLYAHGASSLNGSILGVLAWMYSRKDDAGVRQIAAVCKSGGSQPVGATQTLASTYQYFGELYLTDPNTAAAWTQTNLNAAEFGIKLIA